MCLGIFTSLQRCIEQTGDSDKPNFSLFFSAEPLGFLWFITNIILIFVLLQYDFLNSRFFCVLEGIKLKGSCGHLDGLAEMRDLYLLNIVVVWGE